MEESDNSKLENILQELKFGKFHLRIYVLIAIMVVCLRMSGSSYIFTSRDMSYRCFIPNCDTENSTLYQPWLSAAMPFRDEKPKKCVRYAIKNVTVFDAVSDTSVLNDTCYTARFNENVTESCDRWIFEDGDTIVNSFDIPCEDWKRSLVGSINSVGYFASTLYSGSMSDRFGRKNVMITMSVATGAVGLIQSFSPNYWTFLALEFLNLAVSAGAFSVMYTMAIEIIPTSKRIYGSCIISTSYAVGGILLSSIAMVLPTWRSLLRAANLPALIGIISFFAIPESVRWLNAKGKRNQCKDILQKAAKLNNITFSQKNMAVLDDMSTTEAIPELAIQNSILTDGSKDEKVKVERPFLTIIKTPQLLIRLLVCSFCWFVNLLVFQGISLNSVNIVDGGEGNYLNVILVFAIELPAIVLYLTVLRFTERKFALFGTLLSCGVFCLTYALMPDSDGPYGIVVYLLCKLFIAMAFDLVALIASELFPTCLRNSLLNFCALAGSIGSALAPQVTLLNKIHANLPMITFGVFPLVSAFTVLFLPKTGKKNLPDTVKDAAEL